MKMQIGVVTFLVALSVASLFEFGLASPNTVPAFLWSLHLQSANGELDEAVNYQVMSAKDLVDSVFTQGGWSNFLLGYIIYRRVLRYYSGEEDGLDMRKALSRDVEKKSVIPLKRPITPDELEYD